MNEIQERYMVAKAAYDTAFEMENWELVDQLEDPYLLAEFALVDWMFDEVIKTGKLSKEDAEMMKKRSNTEQWKKFVDMSMKLAV